MYSLISKECRVRIESSQLQVIRLLYVTPLLQEIYFAHVESVTSTCDLSVRTPALSHGKIQICLQSDALLKVSYAVSGSPRLPQFRASPTFWYLIFILCLSGGCTR